MAHWYSADVHNPAEARRHIGPNVATCFVRKRQEYTVGGHTFPALVMLIDAGLNVARLLTPQEARACLALREKLDGTTNAHLDERFKNLIAA